MNVRRVACAAVTVVAAITVATATVAPVASAGVPPPPPPLEDCARFAALRDAFDALGDFSTKANAFAGLDRAARAFKKAAAKAPHLIAADMKLLAASFADLAHSLRPLRSKLHRTKKLREYDAMVKPMQKAFERWMKRQDVEKLTAAQTHVQDWLTNACGFELGSGGTSGGTATCSSADEATQTVFNAWKAGDKTAASGCATDAAVAELFALPTSAGMEYVGCDGVDSNTADCSYRYEGGSLTMRASRAEAGWRVTDITGRAD